MDVQKQSSVGWLLLAFTLPTKRASQRVEVWRKLQHYGTVPLGNSGYLLPSNPVNEERFQWLAAAIRKYGGDASIVHVQGIDNISTPQLIGRFAEARAREYQELIKQLDAFSALPLQKRAVGRLSRLRSRFQEIVEVDFFESPLQKRAGELLAKADASRVTVQKAETPKINPRDYKSRVWVTRPRPGVDRSACAWLIRRFIDSKARFAFAPEEKVPDASLPFDIPPRKSSKHASARQRPRFIPWIAPTIQNCCSARTPSFGADSRRTRSGKQLRARFIKSSCTGVHPIRSVADHRQFYLCTLQKSFRERLRADANRWLACP